MSGLTWAAVATTAALISACSDPDNLVAEGEVAGRHWSVRVEQIDGDTCLTWDVVGEHITGGACDHTEAPRELEVASSGTAESPRLLLVYGVASDEVARVELHGGGVEVTTVPKDVDGLEARSFALAVEEPDEPQLRLVALDAGGDVLETQTIVAAD